MRIRIAAVTNKGSVRAENQDAIAFSRHVLIGDDSGVIQDDLEFSELPKVFAGIDSRISEIILMV